MAVEKIIKVGVVVNRSKPGARDILRQLIGFAAEHSNLELYFEKKTAELIHGKGLSEKELAKKVDILVVAGGDGSLLDVVEEVYPAQVPILGVNIGSLGFLTAVAQTEVGEMLPYLAGNDLRLSPRLALETRLHQDGKTTVVPCALNDVVVFRSSISRLIRVRVEIGKYLVTEYVCDGLIVATPTGSTAYSLAAGGPILSPDADSLVLTPICPHTLTNRALVVGTDQTIRLSVPKQKGVPAPVVQIDGRLGGRLQEKDWLEIRPAKAKVQLAYLPHSDFYHVLRQKLKWSGANI